jgi:hypothetical protein
MRWGVRVGMSVLVAGLVAGLAAPAAPAQGSYEDRPARTYITASREGGSMAARAVIEACRRHQVDPRDAFAELDHTDLAVLTAAPHVFRLAVWPSKTIHVQFLDRQCRPTSTLEEYELPDGSVNVVPTGTTWIVFTASQQTLSKIDIALSPA